MKKSFIIIICLCSLLMPFSMKAQQLVSMPVTDAKTGATFTYSLGEEDVEALYNCYKMAKKEDGAVDVVAKEAFRTLLINHFAKSPKSTAEHLRYARLTFAALKLTEALVGNKKEDKALKEGKAAQATVLLLQELLGAKTAGVEVKN
jgi:hypothetical protein